MEEAAKASLAIEPTAQAANKRFAAKTVPRWLRMSLRIAILVGLVSLPALYSKEMQGGKYKALNVVLLALGGMVLPIWEPLLGNIVLTFTIVLPVGLAGVWLAYGLFVGCADIIFMMGACVVVTFIVFFFAELLSLPVAVLSVLATIFAAAANTYVSNPKMAYAAAVLLTVVLALSAVIASIVCWLVFPEFNHDEVFRHHNEMLEHLMHLTCYALGSRPPPLLKRVATSSATAFLKGPKLKALFASASEAPAPLAALSTGNSLSASSMLSAASGGVLQPDVATSLLGGEGAGAAAWQKIDRSWYRMMMSCQAAGTAQVGAKAEVVIMAAAHKRIIVPCCPLIPCAQGQVNEAALLALRHVSLNTALQVIKLFNATHPLGEATSDILAQLMSSAQWQDMRSSLLASFQELVDSFPFDYYPQQQPIDRQHLAAFSSSISTLLEAWEGNKLVHPSLAPPAATRHPAATPAASAGKAYGDASAGDVVMVPAAEAAAAAAAAGADSDAAVEVLTSPLLLAGTPAAVQLARLHVLLIIELLQGLCEVLEQLYSVAGIAAASIIRCKCC